jgi:hypothetical protein
MCKKVEVKPSGYKNDTTTGRNLIVYSYYDPVRKYNMYRLKDINGNALSGTYKTQIEAEEKLKQLLYKE